MIGLEFAQLAIDMSPAFVKGVRDNLGNAQSVFDKFQVVTQGDRRRTPCGAGRHGRTLRRGRSWRLLATVPDTSPLLIASVRPDGFELADNQ
jgi:transposase